MCASLFTDCVSANRSQTGKKLSGSVMDVLLGSKYRLMCPRSRWLCSSCDPHCRIDSSLLELINQKESNNYWDGNRWVSKWPITVNYIFLWGWKRIKLSGETVFIDALLVLYLPRPASSAFCPSSPDGDRLYLDWCSPESLSGQEPKVLLPCSMPFFFFSFYPDRLWALVLHLRCLCDVAASCPCAEHSRVKKSIRKVTKLDWRPHPATVATHCAASAVTLTCLLLQWLMRRTHATTLQRSPWFSATSVGSHVRARCSGCRTSTFTSSASPAKVEYAIECARIPVKRWS